MTVNTMMRTISYPVRALAKPLIHVCRKSPYVKKGAFHKYIDRFQRAVDDQKWKKAYDIWRKLPASFHNLYGSLQFECTPNILHIICISNPPHQFLIDMAQLLAPLASRATENRHVYPLHMAAKHGSCNAVIQTVLQWYPYAAKYWDIHGNTPLIYACAIDGRNCKLREKVNIVRTLLYAAPEVIDRVNAEGKTAISCVIAAVIAPKRTPVIIFAIVDELWMASRKECYRLKRELEYKRTYEENPLPFPRFEPSPILSNWNKEDQLIFDKIDQVAMVLDRDGFTDSANIDDNEAQDITEKVIRRQLFDEASDDDETLEIKQEKELLGSSYDTESISDDDDSFELEQCEDVRSATSKEEENSLPNNVVDRVSISVEDYSFTFLIDEDDDTSYPEKGDSLKYENGNTDDEDWTTEEEESFCLEIDSDGDETSSVLLEWMEENSIIGENDVKENVLYYL
eukprot:scaffold35411_cov56-Attheya_sp.AAC.6